jgi:hypothetical protein
MLVSSLSLIRAGQDEPLSADWRYLNLRTARVRALRNRLTAKRGARWMTHLFVIDSNDATGRHRYYLLSSNTTQADRDYVSSSSQPEIIAPATR